MIPTVLLTAWLTGALVFPTTFWIASERSEALARTPTEQREAWASALALAAIWPLALAVAIGARRKIRSL